MQESNPVKIETIAGHVCLGLARLFMKGPLRRFNGIERALGDRFASKENYVADRVSNVSDYRKLFNGFVNFEGKTVLELGCSTGYLLNSFLQQEDFTAIGADISASVLARARANYGNRIQFVQTTPTSIPLPSESVEIGRAHV